MFKRLPTIVVLTAVLAVVAAMHTGAQPPGGPGGPPPGGPGGPNGPGGFRGRPGGPPMGMMRAPADSFASERDSLMNEVLERIQGKENVAAESVFRNVKAMKGLPAGRFVRAMNYGFGHALGVSCRHCHIVGHWADDDKPTKQITRDMMNMVDTINDSLLAKIPNLKHEGEGEGGGPRVTCTTCHRGQPRPATRM